MCQNAFLPVDVITFWAVQMFSEKKGKVWVGLGTFVSESPRNYFSGFFWLKIEKIFFLRKEKMPVTPGPYVLDEQLCIEKYNNYNIIVDGCEYWIQEKMPRESSG